VTFRVADNLLQGHGLRWNIFERVQSYSNPLWLFLVTPLYAGLGDIYVAFHVLSIVCLMGMLLLLLRPDRAPMEWALIVALLISSRAFMDFTGSGLENPFTYLAVATFYA